MARIPGAGADVLDADLGILGIPDLVQTVLVEQNRHVERVARGEGEVAAEHRHLGRRGHRVVVGLHRVDRAALHRLEQLARRHQLVGIEQLDLHPVAGDLVEHRDRRIDHVFGQRRARVGLHPPADRRLRDRGRGQAGGGNRRGGAKELASGRHLKNLSVLSCSLWVPAPFAGVFYRFP